MEQATNTTSGSIKIHWTCPRCGHEQEEAMDAGDSVYDIRVSCRKCQEWIEVML